MSTYRGQELGIQIFAKLLVLVVCTFSSSMGACPFRGETSVKKDLWQSEELLLKYKQSLISSVSQEEISLRNGSACGSNNFQFRSMYSFVPFCRPSKKNNFGPCSTEPCQKNLKYRTFSGCGNNIVSDKNYGRQTNPLKVRLGGYFNLGHFRL